VLGKRLNKAILDIAQAEFRDICFGPYASPPSSAESGWQGPHEAATGVVTQRRSVSPLIGIAAPRWPFATLAADLPSPPKGRREPKNDAQAVCRSTDDPNGPAGAREAPRVHWRSASPQAARARARSEPLTRAAEGGLARSLMRPDFSEQQAALAEIFIAPASSAAQPNAQTCRRVKDDSSQSTRDIDTQGLQGKQRVTLTAKHISGRISKRARSALSPGPPTSKSCSAAPCASTSQAPARSRRRRIRSSGTWQATRR
jgi:hypothetical protein